MDCDICSRAISGRRRPLCATCAHSILYGPRVEQATALLAREKHHAHAEAVVRPGNDGVLAALPEDADLDAISSGMRRHSLERSRAEQEATEHRINDIARQAEQLKQEMEQYKARIESQKARMHEHSQALDAARAEQEKIRPRALDPVQITAKKAYQRLEKVRGRMLDARQLLCREAALALNFQRRKGANGRSEYLLGGIPIPDLRELNIKTQPQAKGPLVGGRTVAEPHDKVSEAFDNVARLLNLCAYYLSVRLPGELLLPHENFPRTAIMPEKASYKYKNIKFPGLSPSQSSSPAASRIIEQNQPRPRPLWLDRPLAQLAKEDPKSYGLYVEGVTMLAYNVAWLCRTQGIENINNFDEVCAFGRNLYHLLFGHHRRTTQKPPIEGKQTGASSKVTDLSGKTEPAQDPVKLGTFSHNSALHNLAMADGLDFMKSWRVGSSGRLADTLRNYLLTEISGAEWDYLEEHEWEEDREDEQPVLVAGSRRSHDSRHPAMSIMTVAAHDGAEDERAHTSTSEGQQTKKKSGNGWMKVRGR